MRQKRLRIGATPRWVRSAARRAGASTAGADGRSLRGVAAAVSIKVTDAADGLDTLVAVRGRTKLAANGADEVVDAAVGVGKFAFEHGAEQIFARDAPAR